MKHILLFFILASLILPGCTKKKENAIKTPAQVQEEENLPQLEQNLVYLANQENLPRPKDLSFEESSDQTYEKKVPNSLFPTAAGD